MALRRVICFALFALTYALTVPIAAGAAPIPDPPPGQCQFGDHGLGHYIVFLQEWVDDPEAIAAEQVERYGGELGFVDSALKAYSAAFPIAAIPELEAEPTVNYVEPDPPPPCPKEPPDRPSREKEEIEEEPQPPPSPSPPPSSSSGAIPPSDAVVETGMSEQQPTRAKRHRRRCKGRRAKKHGKGGAAPRRCPKKSRGAIA